jgi:hypothetical protein
MPKLTIIYPNGEQRETTDVLLVVQARLAVEDWNARINLDRLVDRFVPPTSR